jgi:signal transduction histidine kinase
MPGTALARQFRARMLPLAALAGITTALVPPAGFGLYAWQRHAAEARLDADQVARALHHTVERQGWLWRYNAEKIVRATVVDARSRGHATVRITDCKGQPIFPIDAAPIGGRAPAAWAPVRALGETVAWVFVQRDLGGDLKALVLVASGAALLGLGLALLLYVHPARVVRQQSEQLLSALAAGRVVAVQEEERSRIARDLHDGIGQSLAALQLELSLARSRPAEADARLVQAIAALEAAIGELRRVVHDLRPPELEGVTPAEALRDCSERFELRSGVPTSFRVEGEGPALRPEVAACLLRVLQEALTNVGRHAAAKEVGVTLRLSAREVSLEVVDDGRGFDAAAPVRGAGLRGIRERCTFLGGRAEITSSGGTTRVAAHLPVERDAA